MTDNENTSSKVTFRSFTLQNVTCAEEEINALESLKETVVSSGNETLKGEDDCEKEWLRKGLGETVNPFPTKSPESLLPLEDELNNFTFYLFERRFGWSECTANLEELEEDKLERRGSSASLRIQDNSKFKAKLNELLDEFLKWYLAQPKLSEKLLQSLNYAVSKAHNMPVVRNQTFVHIMDWFKLASAVSGFSDDLFSLVKDLILAGISDVWSAIRNTCVAKLSKFLEIFTLHQVEEFYSSLVKMCQAKETSWQAKEGAVMCMTAIVCQFLWSRGGSETSNGSQYTLKFGLVKLAALPDFILLSVRSVLYSLLAHPQLSIREHATKALSAILSRCEFEVALGSFGEVINRLCRGTQSESSGGDSQGIHELPHHAVFRQNFKFLKAHEAQGLLGVCLFLIKHIPPGYLLPKWPLYFSTLNLFLMHPASTVRQAASTTFKYLVAKDSSNPVFLKLVLQGLAADWKIKADLLTANLTRTSRPHSSQGFNTDRLDHSESSASNTVHDSDDEVARNVPDSETQFQTSPSPPPSPDLCYMSADSLSSMGMEFQGDVSSGPIGSASSPHRLTRISIRQVARLLSEGSVTPADELMSESWEWREGRLLAYELIMKFLITNHIHYVFPTFVLPVSKDSAASSSVDETLISSLSNKGPGKKSMFVRDRSKSDFSAESASSLSKSVGIINSASSALYTTTTIKEGESGFMEKGHAVEDALQQNNDSSTLSKKKAVRAMSYAEMDANTHTRQLIRQYSVTTPQISPKRPFRLPRTSTFALGNSLLNQTKELDSEQSQSEELTDEVLFQCLKSPFGWSRSASGDEASDKRPLSLSTLEGDEVPQWTNALQLITLSSVLAQVLLQTIECLADARWELRRMGQQVLPLVTEVVRWFDMKPLENLWNNYLTRSHTLLCYGGCISLRYSILHAGRLLHFLEQPPPSWKDPESCGRAALIVVAEIQRGLKKWMSQVHDVLQHPCFDKLSVVAMETMMMSHICFPLGPDEYEQKLHVEETVLNKVLFLYVHSYPDHPLSDVLRSSPGLEILLPFVPPSEGFLCFSARVSTVEQHAQQAGKYLISEVYPLLPRFLKECDADQMVMVFPVLVHYIGQFFEDSAVCRALLDGLYIILYRVEELHMIGDEGEDLQSLVQLYLDFSFLGLSEVITTKELELQVVREVLETFIRVCIFVEAPTFLGIVFKSIISRLDYEPDLVRLMSEEDCSRNETPDLLFLSNDIPTSPAEELMITGEEEDEPEAGRVMQESVALDTSHESSRGTTRLPSPEVTDDQFSDWDSWEDENENHSAHMALFADFLRAIYKVYKSKTEEGHSAFDEELLRSGETETKAITNIMAFQE